MSNTFVNVPVGKQAQNMDISPQFQPYSGVEIIVNEDESIFVGDRSGRVLSITNPWGSRQQAEDIYSSLTSTGFQYQPYTATSALLNPAAEIGDGVTLNGFYSGIYKMTRNFNSLMSADIEAPQDEEVDHEYPFEPKQDRIFRRQIEDAQAQISLTQSEIAAKVSTTGGNNSSFGWSLLSDKFSLYAGNKEVFKCTSSGVEIQGKIIALSGTIGGFNIGASSIYNGMTSINSTSSGVYVGTNGIAVGGGNFKVTSGGSVSAKNMTLTGTLNIGGTNITAAALRSGAQSAYNNSSTWSTGSGYGYNYNRATQNGTTSYPSYFTVGSFTCNSIRASSINFGGRRLSIGSIPNGSGGYWQVVMWS